MSQLRVGFIGLGSQGGPMAHRIAEAGLPLTVWARRPDVLDAYTAKGAEAAAGAAQLGSVCDVVGVCVVDDAGVAEICGQLIPAMRAGSLLAVHSTILPASCEALASRCAEKGILFLDAPVSGGSPAAEAGALTVMCGGSEEAFALAKPVFETFGRMIVLLGPAGSGQRAKLVNNALLAAHLGLAHAALGAGAALGIDRAALAELIKASSGRSYGFEIAARLPSPAAFEHGAPLLVKDVNLLRHVLPGDDDAVMLEAAANHFLGPATAG